jgi:hypothetical protein
MVSSVSSAQPLQPVNSQSPKPSPAPAASQSEAPQDSVQLSAAAQKILSGGAGNDANNQ